MIQTNSCHYFQASYNFPINPAHQAQAHILMGEYLAVKTFDKIVFKFSSELVLHRMNVLREVALPKAIVLPALEFAVSSHCQHLGAP